MGTPEYPLVDSIARVLDHYFFNNTEVAWIIAQYTLELFAFTCDVENVYQSNRLYKPYHDGKKWRGMRFTYVTSEMNGRNRDNWGGTVDAKDRIGKQLLGLLMCSQQYNFKYYVDKPELIFRQH